MSSPSSDPAPAAPAHPYLVVAFVAGRPVAGPRFGLEGFELVRFGRSSVNRVERGSGGQGKTLSLHLADPRMSTTHGCLVHLGGRFIVEDLGSKNGTIRNGVPVRRSVLEDGDFIEAGETFLVYRDGHDAPVAVADRESPTGEVEPGEELETLSQVVESQLHVLARAAEAGAPALLLGEHGTGKERLARALHERSGRTGPFVPVTCTSLPDELFEGILFGHAEGGFVTTGDTGPGLFRSADGGTLYLDEIADLPLPVQMALQRVLLTGEVVPVGTTTALPIDVRVIAASVRDVDALASTGHVRRELLAILASHQARLPPLRERREDMGLVTAEILRRLDARPDLVFAPDALRVLFRHPWSENVDELENVLRRTLAVARGECLYAADIVLEDPSEVTPVRPESG